MRRYLLPILISNLLLLNVQRLTAHEAEQHFTTGIQAFNQGTLQDAIIAFGQAIHSYPGYAQAHFMLGRVYYQQKNYQQAQTAFQNAIDHYPGYAEAHYMLGLSLHQQAQFEAASKATREAIKRYPRYEEAHYLSATLAEQRHVEISEVDPRDRLLIRIRDARTGRIQGQYFAEELDSHPGRVFDVVAGITSGAKQLDGDVARQLGAMLTEPDNDIRTYLVAMSKLKMYRGPALASFINDIEERLESLLDDPDQQIKPETLVRLLALKRDEMKTDLDFMRSMLIPKKGDPLSAVPPVVHDNRSVDTHEYIPGSEFSPAQRDLLRNLIEALSEKAKK